MLVGWSAGRGHGGAPVCWLRGPGGPTRRGGPPSPGNRPGGVLEVRAETPTYLPHLRTW